MQTQTTTDKKFKNPNRISVKQWRTDEGLLNDQDFSDRLDELEYDGAVPAMCAEGCAVEPDGRCEHNCPSLFLAMGVI